MITFLAKRRQTVSTLAAAAVGLTVTVGLVAAVGSLTGWIAAGVLVAATLLLVFLARWLRRRVPRHTFLEVDLERRIVEQVAPGAGRLLDQGALRLRDVVDGLDRAAGDDRVEVLVARIGTSGMGLAQAQELRDAVARFRAAGKTAIAYAETFGEDRSAIVDFYLASAFDRVYLQPAGSLGLAGMLTRVPFLRGVFDKLGLVPRLEHREEYKAAKNRLTETEFTPAHREVVNAILDSQFDSLVAGIAAGRGLDADTVRVAIDRGPLWAQEALDAGLVDELAHRDEVYDQVADRAGAKPMYLETYLKRARRIQRKGPVVALVYATGAVTRGKSRFSLVPTPEYTMGSDTVGAALRAARSDDKVKAVVFRVDSPGGSAVASDVILREVVRTREAGKPVVVTMGDVAGSGGYYISAKADRIVAQPGTITGSIGVVMGKLVAAEAWERVGLTFDHASRGRNARFWSSGYDYDDQGRARVESGLDDVYERFMGHVADGRNIDRNRVRELAKGRVWTGEQAHERGLVDELGGMDTALRLAKELAGIDQEATVKLVEFPKRKRRLPGQRPESSEAAAMIQESLRMLEPVTAAVTAGLPRGELVVPPGL